MITHIAYYNSDTNVELFTNDIKFIIDITHGDPEEPQHLIYGYSYQNSANLEDITNTIERQNCINEIQVAFDNMTMTDLHLMMPIMQAKLIEINAIFNSYL